VTVKDYKIDQDNKRTIKKLMYLLGDWDSTRDREISIQRYVVNIVDDNIH
jgi:hypothetical protein